MNWLKRTLTRTKPHNSRSRKKRLHTFEHMEQRQLLAADVQLEILPGSSGPEGDAMIFYVRQTGDLSHHVSVNYHVVGGGSRIHPAATPVADFEPVAGTITFTGKTKTEEIHIPIRKDSIDDEPESLTVWLSGATNGAKITRAKSVGLITNAPILGCEICHHSPFSFDHGVWGIKGSAADDQVTVSLDRSRTRFVVHATIGGVNYQGIRWRTQVSQIRFDAGPGDDLFNYQPYAGSSLPQLELLGGAGNDTFYGGRHADSIRGGDGNDVIHSFGGDDVVFGGAGDDIIVSGSGDDFIYGGGGDDRLYDGSGQDVVYTGGQMRDAWYDGPGTDIIHRRPLELQALSGDWNGDGTDETGFYVPREGIFVLHGFSTPYFRFGPKWGTAIVGNFDRDGRTDVGVAFNHGHSKHYTLDVGRIGGHDPVYSFGFSTDEVFVGDWNGDGVDQFGVYRMNTPTGPHYYLDEAAPGWTGQTAGERGHQFGLVGDQVFVGDWNGDGIDEIGVFRESAPGGPRYLLDEYDPSRLLFRGWGNYGVSEVIGYTFGKVGDQPVIGDWNNDGIDDFGVFRKQGRNGVFFLDENARGSQGITAAETVGYVMGRHTDIPLIGDWDGDGADNMGIYRAVDGRDIVALDIAFRGWGGSKSGEWGM